jgi:hypothetical protein
MLGNNKKDASPYLLVDSEKGPSSEHVDNTSSEHVLNPLASASSPMAKPGDAQSTSAEPAQSMYFTSTRALICHVAEGLFAFLSFVILGATSSGVSVSSGDVSVSELLASAGCTSAESPISGKLNFNANRFLLVIGILTWLYCMASIALALIKRVTEYFVNKVPGVTEEKLNMVALVSDITFTLLSFIAFLAGAIYITVPQKLSFGESTVFFTIESFWLTIADLSLCQSTSKPNPLPSIRASIALIFFSAVAGCACIITQVQAYRQQEKLKKQNFQNCL